MTQESENERDEQATLVFKLTEPTREKILRRFPPQFSYVDADHITYKTDVPTDTPLPPKPHSARVVGHAHGEALEALVVEVNDSTVRPDRGTYHITLSYEPQQREAKDSNALLKVGWTQCEPIEVDVEPERRIPEH